MTATLLKHVAVKIDPLKILHVVKLPIYSDRAHRDESNGLITGKNNTTCIVRFFHPTLHLYSVLAKRPNHKVLQNAKC